MKSFIVTALMVLSVSYSQAQEGSSSMLFGKEEAAVAPRGLLPFIAAGGGYTGYDTFQDAEGTPATIKLLGSWYLESPWVMDLGYGVNNQQFIHTSALDTASTEGALEIAARYRTDNRWQMGVVANQFFDQGVNYAADQADAQFVGLQLLKEFNMSPSWLARLGARAQALTNNTDGVVAMYLVDLQIGWNPGAYRPSAKAAGAAAVPAAVVAEEVLVEEDEVAMSEPSRPATVTPSSISEVSFSELAPAGTAAAITFGSARAAVSQKDQQRLDKIARALRDNPDLVERVEVRGYADSSGSIATNERISQQRANSVSSALKRSGMGDVEVVAVGKGATDSFGSKSQDRRAELIFHGVKDEDALRRALSDIE